MADPLDQARCRTVGHPTWWDDEINGETEVARARRHAKAKRECGRCPAVLACVERFDPALDAGVWFGVLHSRSHRTHNTTAHLGKRTRRTA